MSLMRRLQDRPHLLERSYRLSKGVLKVFSRWLQPGGFVEGFFIRAERIGKKALFDCRMCGQCVLHETGMTCPMTCPKNLLNGPCGGVRLDGSCEVKPEMPCVWVQAWQRSRHMPVYGDDILELLPPLDHSLEGTSAWINDFSGRTSCGDSRECE